MSEFGPERNTPETQDAEHVIEGLLSEYGESISDFSMTLPYERDRFYSLPPSGADEYMPYVDWERKPRESHSPIPIRSETKIAELNSVKQTAKEKLKALEEDPDSDVLDLLTAEAKAKKSITVAEQFGPDMVDDKLVIRAKGRYQEIYVQVRKLVGLVDEQCRIYEDAQLALITVPGLLLIRELAHRNRETETSVGFRPQTDPSDNS